MKKAQPFDLGSIDTIAACNKPTEIEIKHPVSKMGTGFFVSIVGKDSNAYRGRVRAMADENIRRGDRETSLEKMEAKSVEALVDATVAWRTGDEMVATLRGEKLEFTPENVRRVYIEILPVREQVAEAIADYENFFGS